MTEHLAKSYTSNADGVINDLRVNCDYDSEDEKPILLELGAPSNSARNTSELNLVPYTNTYPLDLHLNSAFSSVFPTFSHAYNFDPAIFYNNPYTSSNKIPTSASQISQMPTPHSSATSSLISRNAVPYSGHLQNSYTWTTPTPVTLTEIVPPPVCMTYSDNCEHTITQRTNQSRKEKPLQTEKDYKKTACDRERTRMRDMNRAFDLLRSKLPISKPNGKKYSKIESLRIAINYINHLQNILEDDAVDKTAAKYFKAFNVRRKSSSYRFESKKSNSLEDASNTLENLDESLSTWSDSYTPNSQEKWE